MATTPRECQGKRLALHLTLSLGWSPVGLTCRLAALVYVTPEPGKHTHTYAHARTRAHTRRAWHQTAELSLAVLCARGDRGAPVWPCSQQQHPGSIKVFTVWFSRHKQQAAPMHAWELDWTTTEKNETIGYLLKSDEILLSALNDSLWDILLHEWFHLQSLKQIS